MEKMYNLNHHISQMEIYVNTILIGGVLTSTVWLQEYSLIFKALTLIYGIMLLMLNKDKTLRLRNTVSILFIFAIFCLIINAIIYANEYGLKGFLFPLFDLILCLLVFNYFFTNYERSKFTNIARYYCYVSFITTGASLVLCYAGYQLYYNNHVYGLSSDGYGYGIFCAPYQLGYSAIISIIIATYIIKNYRNKLFYITNCCIQIAAVFECAMREFLLVLILYFIMMSVASIKIKNNSWNKLCLSIMLISLLSFAIIFASHVSMGERKSEKMMANLTNEMIISAEGDAREITNAIEAYYLIENNKTLSTLNMISTERVLIWTTTIMNSNMIGMPEQTIKVLRYDGIRDSDVHNAYIRTLRIYGLMGFIPIMAIVILLLKRNIYVILYKRDNKNRELSIISIAVVSIVLLDTLGGAISASFDYSVVGFWTFAGISMNKNYDK